MSQTDFTRESHPAGFDPIPPTLARAIELDFELSLEGKNAFEQVVDTRRHERSMSIRP